MRVAAVACATLLAGIYAGGTAAPASASWTQVHAGVGYGWVSTPGLQPYAWVKGSDAALWQLGATESANLGCAAVTDDTLAWGCKWVARWLIKWWIANDPNWQGDGHWVVYYPYESPHVWYGAYSP